MGKKLALSLILAFLLWGLARPAFAEGGKLLFGESFTLRRGEIYTGDVVIFGGNLTLEERSLLEGDVAVFGGGAKIAGTLRGDLVVFGGGIWVGSKGRIEGDVVIMGGKLEKEEGAVITGEVTEMKVLSWPRAPFLPMPLYLRYRPFEDVFGWLLGRSVRFILTLLALMAASVLIISLWPEQVRVVAETATKAPLESGGIGLAALVLGVPVGLVLLIAACLGLLVWLALLIAGLFGLTALAYEVGKRVLESSGARETSPIFQALLGVALIQILDLIPCLGSLLLLVVYSLGIGAVILSRFGTYQGYWVKEEVGGASGNS